MDFEQVDGTRGGQRVDSKVLTGHPAVDGRRFQSAPHQFVNFAHDLIRGRTGADQGGIPSLQ